MYTHTRTHVRTVHPPQKHADALKHHWSQVPPSLSCVCRLNMSLRTLILQSVLHICSPLRRAKKRRMLLSEIKKIQLAMNLSSLFHWHANVSTEVCHPPSWSSWLRITFCLCTTCTNKGVIIRAMIRYKEGLDMWAVGMHVCLDYFEAMI